MRQPYSRRSPRDGAAGACACRASARHRHCCCFGVVAEAVVRPTGPCPGREGGVLLPEANLDDDSGIWPTSYALTELSQAGEEAITELVTKAVSADVVLQVRDHAWCSYQSRTRSARSVFHRLSPVAVLELDVGRSGEVFSSSQVPSRNARSGGDEPLAQAECPPPLVGYRLGRDRGRPNDGSTEFSNRVMAQIRSPVRVRTRRPTPWRMPVGLRR
jgi:hypothetical protein